uniref:Nitrogen fixation protein NifX n=1 Tax=Candidatus Kentrum sp. FW TaxID=2126338 RepID=A0A450THS7_9GAMM|nr:MAG: nitrogen fixation protein NifX [Candidatus Kentron sp. FW]
MNTQPISDDIALRIALAARQLPNTDTADLLRLLDKMVGLPPWPERLSRLTVKDLKSAAGEKYDDAGAQALQSALACLRGEYDLEDKPPPETEPFEEGDMPGSIRVACASNQGEILDGHFGSCRRFLVYQVSQFANRLVGVRVVDHEPAQGGKTQDDKIARRIALIADCRILFVASIGGPATARVVRAGIHPVKKTQIASAREEIRVLQNVMGENAPPWIKKAMSRSLDPEASKNTT